MVWAFMFNVCYLRNEISDELNKNMTYVLRHKSL